MLHALAVSLFESTSTLPDLVCQSFISATCRFLPSACVCVCVNLGKYDVRELVRKFQETWLDPLAWPTPCGGEVDDDKLVTSLCDRAVELRPAHKFGLGTSRHKNSLTSIFMTSYHKSDAFNFYELTLCSIR